MSGSRLRLVAPTRPARDALYAYHTGLDDQPTGYWEQPRFAAPLGELRAASGGQVAIAFGRGGLLQALDAWQNALLPVSFHASHDVPVAARRARGIFAALGRSPEDFAGRFDGQLSLYERRLVGFAKAMLTEPQLLVLDRLFEDLGHEEQKGVAGFIELFRRRYPLRRMLYVGLTETVPGFLSEFEPLATMETVP